MISLICRWYILRAGDASRPLPAWVASRIERSPSLRAMRRRVAEVDRGLRRAPREAVPRSWRTDVLAAIASEGAPVGRRRWRHDVLTGAVCATLLIVGLVSVRLMSPEGPAERPRMASSQPAPADAAPAGPAIIAATMDTPTRREARRLVRDVVLAADRWAGMVHADADD